MKMPPPLKKLSALTFVALTLASSAVAQISFTITATSDSNNNNYVQGNSYSFVFTSGASFANTPSSTVTSVTNPQRNFWTEESTSDDQLWASVSGSGVTGSFVRPTTNSGDPYSNLGFEKNNPSTNIFSIYVGADSSNTGLLSLSADSINGIDVSNVTGASIPDFTVNSSYVEPVDSSTGYFAGYYGTYADLSGTLTIYYSSGLVTNNTFTVTSLSIASAAAVPEPSTYAALAGLAALGFVAVRRRRALAAR